MSANQATSKKSTSPYSCAFCGSSDVSRIRWFGLILLPIVSFSADGCVAIVFFCKRVLDHIFGGQTMTPSQLAKARAIDLSIQFTLFWMPFLVLLGWWIEKPMHLMFGEWSHAC